MRSGSCARSAWKVNSPVTSITTRVVSLKGQQRTAVTRRTSSPRAGPARPVASSTRSGMSMRFIERSMRNIVNLAAGIHHLANGVANLRRGCLRGFLLDRLDGGSLPSGFQPAAYFGDVIPGLGEWRHAAKARDRAFSGIIGGQGQGFISLIQVQQILQITGAALNVVGRIEDVGHAESPGGGGNQLHQP